MSSSKSTSHSETQTTTTTSNADNRVAATGSGVAIGSNAIGNNSQVVIDSLSPDVLAAGQALLDKINTQSSQLQQQDAAIQQQANTAIKASQNALVYGVGGVVLVAVIFAITKKDK